jgi:hypothetical protein
VQGKQESLVEVGLGLRSQRQVVVTAHRFEWEAVGQKEEEEVVAGVALQLVWVKSQEGEGFCAWEEGCGLQQCLHLQTQAHAVRIQVPAHCERLVPSRSCCPVLQR